MNINHFWARKRNQEEKSEYSRFFFESGLSSHVWNQQIKFNHKSKNSYFKKLVSKLNSYYFLQPATFCWFLQAFSFHLIHWEKQGSRVAPTSENLFLPYLFQLRVSRENSFFQVLHNFYFRNFRGFVYILAEFPDIFKNMTCPMDIIILNVSNWWVGVFQFPLLQSIVLRLRAAKLVLWFSQKDYCCFHNFGLLKSRHFTAIWFFGDIYKNTQINKIKIEFTKFRNFDIWWHESWILNQSIRINSLSKLWKWTV